MDPMDQGQNTQWVKKYKRAKRATFITEGNVSMHAY